MNQAASRVRATLVWLLDAVIVTLVGVTLWIAISGGTSVTVSGARISLRGVDNPVLLLALASVARYFLRAWSPFLGLGRWRLDGVDAAAFAWITRSMAWLFALDRARALRVIATVAALAVAIKLAVAWSSPGFYSGDDVEVHEMSLAVLWHANWPIWDLRSPVFPLGFIFPAQWLANAAGLQSASWLVFAGRGAVALVSTLAVGLTARAVARDGYGLAVAAAVLLAVNQLHMSFGSSELPRPVSTVLVVAAFLCLRKDLTTARACLAGCFLGIAASLRFSEVVFLVPAIVGLSLRRRFVEAALCLVAAAAMAALLLGITDRLYWGSAFHSLTAVTDYTLVKGLSSRGYQSPLWYFLNMAHWASIPLVVLAAFGVSRHTRDALLWAVIPVLLLSCLPHKEARYLIPVIPFFAILAAYGAGAFADWCGRRLQAGRRVPVALCLLALALGVLHDVGHWRLPRTDADVRFVLAARQIVPEHGVVVGEQIWRMGGHIYLPSRELQDLDPGQLRNPGYLWDRLPAGSWLVLDERSETASLRSELSNKGYEKVLSVEGSRFGLWRP